jgi:predicted RND superfamily exporter protein
VSLDNVGDIVLRFRREIGGALIAATLFMAFAATRMNVSTRFIDFFPARHKNVALSERFGSFGGNQTLVLMVQVKQGDIFNLETLRKIEKITSEVDCLPGVKHQEVFSLSSYRLAYGQPAPGTLNVRTFMYPSVPNSQAEIDALKQGVFAHRELVRHLISDDNRSTLVTATFTEGRFEYPELSRTSSVP